MAEKASTGLIVGLATYVIGQVNSVTIALFLFILIDFGTGLLGARSIGEKITREKLTLGAIKKTGIAVLWFVGIIIQLAVISEGEQIGLTITTPYISLALTFYLLGTETISIFKNLEEMGVKVPRWIRTIAEGFKKDKAS